MVAAFRTEEREPSSAETEENERSEGEYKDEETK